MPEGRFSLNSRCFGAGEDIRRRLGRGPEPGEQAEFVQAFIEGLGNQNANEHSPSSDEYPLLASPAEQQAGSEGSGLSEGTTTSQWIAAEGVEVYEEEDYTEDEIPAAAAACRCQPHHVVPCEPCSQAAWLSQQTPAEAAAGEESPDPDAVAGASNEAAPNYPIYTPRPEPPAAGRGSRLQQCYYCGDPHPDHTGRHCPARRGGGRASGSGGGGGSSSSSSAGPFGGVAAPTVDHNGQRIAPRKIYVLLRVGPEGPEAGIYYGSWAQLLRVIPNQRLPQNNYHYRVAATEAEARELWRRHGHQRTAPVFVLPQ